MIRAAVIGASGYTGVELIRLLIEHDQVDLVSVCSRSNAGALIGDVFPNFRGKAALRFEQQPTAECDVVFFAAADGVAMQQAEHFLDRGVKVIDLAADFRLRDPALWETWYGKKHACPGLLSEAVYGLPEMHRDEVRQARLVANPGCYPTAVLLGFYPLLKAHAVDGKYLIADVKSGVSGAGRRANLGLNLSEVSGSFKAYKASSHRHFPEIKSQLDAVAGRDFELSFTPHLVPMVRGIMATLYFETELGAEKLQEIFESVYVKEVFVHVLPAGSHPETRCVNGVNDCHIAVHKPECGRVGKVLVAIDNLIKGAAGQAVQNMNLTFGIAETAGLRAIASLP